MNTGRVEKIAAAVLYEGYILYPYRASAVKNRQRFNFGTLSPRAYCELQAGADRWEMHTECLIAGDGPSIDVRVRFLHPLLRQVGRPTAPLDVLPIGAVPEHEPVEVLEIGDELHQSWQEVVEREVTVTGICCDGDGSAPSHTAAHFPATESVEALRQPGGEIVGIIVRQQQAIDVDVEIKLLRLDRELCKVSVTLTNQTIIAADACLRRDQAMLHSLASAHIVLGAGQGEFVSLLDPPESYAAAVAGCRNEGCWPVLVGDAGDADLMLASPIILYDYPQVAPESDGDFFDGTEIDEMLALRVMTLTDEEKREMRSVDARTRAILERTEAMPDDHMNRLHGTMSSSQRR